METVHQVPYDRTVDDTVIVNNTNRPAPSGEQFTKRERDTWNTRFDFLLSLIGFSVGLGNVWRFPYLCYKHGGASFLVPYLICVLIGGVPLLFLEIALGQYMQQGGIKCWSIMPLLEGIGYATTIIVFLLDCYYNIILAWTWHYLFSSMQKTLPWSTCDNTWNTPNCTLLANTTAGGNNSYLTDPVTEYWERRVLGIHLSTGVDDPAGIKWDLALCLLFAWIVVYFCIWKGIKTSGKVMYFTATTPYVLMLVLLVRGCTLPGAYDGILFYVVPVWKKMLNTEVWVAAGTQIFFSYSISLGTLTALGSFNKYRHNSYRDACLFALANSGTSILSGFVIFPVLGYMAFKLGVKVEDVAKGGPGLAFIAYPQAVAEMPVAPLWSVLFFFMIILLGLDSQFVGVEGLVTAVSDIYSEKLKEGRRKEIFILLICIVAFFIGLSMVTHGGMYVFQMFDYYSGSRVILLIAFFQLIAISWMYGIKRFYSDLENMLGFRINPYMGFSWLISTPAFCLIMFGFVLSKYEELNYNDTYFYPQEAIGVAWFVACISLAMIPIVAIVKMIMAMRQGRSLWGAWCFLTTPVIPPKGLTEEELQAAGAEGYTMQAHTNKGAELADDGYPEKPSHLGGGGGGSQPPGYSDVVMRQHDPNQSGGYGGVGGGVRLSTRC